jgi:hypothetical protein
MAEFTQYSNVLPNPSNSIAYDGSSSSNTGTTTGPGYASVQVSSKFQTAMDKTNSGVLIARSKAAQSFEVSISYNPLTEEEFMPIYSFLLEKQGMLKSFLVPLPQYDNPQDSTLAGGTVNFAVNNAPGYTAGTSKITIDAAGYAPSSDGALRPGDMITFSDSTDSNHLKAYKITRVETDANYLGTAPNSNELKISISPPLQKSLANNSVVNYKNPKIKVIMKSDIVQYDLKTDNRYAFSLSLQEVQ